MPQTPPHPPQDMMALLTRQPVLVVGDIMLDRFVYGDVRRISPESPVPVLSIQNENAMLGGAGNVLANLAGLGAGPLIVTIVGADEPAAAIRALLKDRGIDDKGLITVAGRPTTVKTRFLAAHQQLLRADFETTDSVGAAVEEKTLAEIDRLLPGAGAVILSDYGKGVLSAKIIAAVIDRARRKNIPVLVDPKGSDYAVYKGASVVTPNRKELSEATGGLPVRTDDDIVRAAQKLMDYADVAAVVATRSQDGMTIVAREGKKFAPPVHLRTEAIEVFDVSGAGDTVVATLAAALAADLSLTDAASIANVAAGLVVAKVGTAPVRAAELRAALAHRELDTRPHESAGTVMGPVREARILAREEAAEAVARWRARGLRIGFTNGCFDILHPGHVAYLNRARDRCDRLVVALNADESVRRLKGPARPVNNAEARATVLAGLAAVDMVVIFGDRPQDDDKPVRLIESLKPDIFFKGGDYREDQLPEAPSVRAHGGEVAIMPLYEGHSTTATISRLKTGGAG